jgi:hypothetical protein
MKQKTYTAIGIRNIVSDLDVEVKPFGMKTVFVFDDRNEKWAEITKIEDNEYTMSEWKPYTYAKSIGV